MQEADQNYTHMLLCNAAHHESTEPLQCVGAQTEGASGKCPGILIAQLI